MKGFTVEFTLFQDPSGFVHQHLVPSVGIDTKSYVGSLSFFHLTTVKPHHNIHRESAKNPRKPNPKLRPFYLYIPHDHKQEDPDESSDRAFSLPIASLSSTLTPVDAKPSIPLESISSPKTTTWWKRMTLSFSWSNLKLLKMPLLSRKKLLVSIDAGIKLKDLQEWAGHSQFIRVMPNTHSAVGAAASKSVKKDRHFAPSVFEQRRKTMVEVMFPLQKMEGNWDQWYEHRRIK
ncbi:hypothetical protein DVH24_029993 [Malus domestica]|uniref:Uncharacterized protein n=1 Tax=Malus domestica TaxID=3750 RepID=A0A498HZ59_MALDO|nr:hypothetical protein DVH24_029993 [Malus domestica]